MHTTSMWEISFCLKMPLICLESGGRAPPPLRDQTIFKPETGWIGHLSSTSVPAKNSCSLGAEMRSVDVKMRFQVQIFRTWAAARHHNSDSGFTDLLSSVSSDALVMTSVTLSDSFDQQSSTDHFPSWSCSSCGIGDQIPVDSGWGWNWKRFIEWATISCQFSAKFYQVLCISAPDLLPLLRVLWKDLRRAHLRNYLKVKVS